MGGAGARQRDSENAPAGPDGRRRPLQGNDSVRDPLLPCCALGVGGFLVCA
jgi:hypothetical protein